MAGAVKDALETIAGAVATPKGRAALSVLETELQAGGRDPNNKSSGGPPRFPKKGDSAAIKAAMASSAKGGATA